MALQLQNALDSKICKYCNETNDFSTELLLQCSSCKQYVHSKCLQRGSVPGSLNGDIFFKYTCVKCTSDATEHFVRDRMTWLQAILLVMYHLQARKKVLARKGYFHWKLHIASFIDQNWDILFSNDMKRKKNWIGTISGTLSHYNPMFFMSGTAFLNEQGWWTLTYPKLPPHIIIQVNEELMIEKQKCKESKTVFDGAEKLNEILENKPYAAEAMQKCNNLLEYATTSCDTMYDESQVDLVKYPLPRRRKNKKEMNSYVGSLLPTVDNILTQSKRRNIVEADYDIPSSNVFKKINIGPFTSGASTQYRNDLKEIKEKSTKIVQYLNFLCHYNTSLESINLSQQSKIHTRLTGSVRKSFILSPYSSICLSPFIWQSVSINPPWLQLMDELKCKVNCKTSNWILEARGSLDFAYVQPNHVPVLNSLCHQFFWNGINLTDILQYPEYTCVVLYKKLIVGFVCVVPNVDIDENYLSFIFVRPAWRKSGIARFMLYHITQVSGGKNITLHVATSNPALIFFQKYGFKIQYLVKNFYEKYLPSDATKFTHAFFCKLNLDC